MNGWAEVAELERAYLVAADSVLDLVGRTEVVLGWSHPSALAQMSVGALAEHLGSQVFSVQALFTRGEGATEEHPAPVLEHYRRVRWATTGVDDESNVAIREGAESDAAEGHDVLTRRLQQAVVDVRTAFARLDPPPAVTMPWWNWSLSFGDFLVTRMMEIVVHGDDLAVSVDVAPPQQPDEVLGPVLALLTGLSLQRHGQAALVRALTRSERATGSISAF